MTLSASAAAGVLAVCAIVDLAAAAWVVRRRGAVGRVSLALLLLAGGIWAGSYSLELALEDPWWRELWGDLQHVGTVLMPPAWLAFALSYTGRGDQLTRRAVALLAIEPVAVAVVLATPATHDLMRSFAPGPVADVPVVLLGPVYWVHFAYTNALVGVGTVILCARLLRVSSLYKRQTVTLSIAVALPLLGNAASSLGLPLARTYDPTPVAITLGGLVIVWGVFRYRLLDLVPVARNLAFDKLADPVLVLDGYGRVIDRNPAAARALGDGAAIGAPLQDLLNRRADLLTATAAGAELRLDRDGELREFELIAAPLEDSRGRLAGRLVHLRDITARKRAERRLRMLADHDGLTRLPNRRLLLDRLDLAIARARRARGRCALLLVDLDRFKLVNDSHGHLAGDRVLATVAERLRHGRRDEDTAARLGGDEFAVLLSEVATPEAARLVASRVLAALAEPMRVGDRELIVTASVGVAVWPDDGDDPDALFSSADTAAYRAKAGGRNRLECGAPAVVAGRSGPHELAADLLRALERDELFLEYQPVVDLRDRRVTGMEALLRWRHPRRGLLTPAAFLPVAAEAGLAGELDRWVLARACAQSARWAGAGRPVPVSVNVSADRFRSPGVPLSDDVAGALRRAELAPDLLVMELTEDAVGTTEGSCEEELALLRELGVGVALDDFGAGHTSLTHLRRLPINTLKVDGTLVGGVRTGSDDARLLGAVTTLAQILGMRVVAEGVERAEQVTALRASGCDGAQGFLFSGPIDAEAAGAMLGSRALCPR